MYKVLQLFLGCISNYIQIYNVLFTLSTLVANFGFNIFNITKKENVIILKIKKELANATIFHLI